MKPAIAHRVQVQRQWRGFTDSHRYANMRRIALTAILCLFSFLCSGCPARWKVVFINGAEEPLSIQLSGSLTGQGRAFALAPDASHSEVLRDVQRLAVFGPSRALLFQRDDFGGKHLAPPLQGKYPHIYVLLTATNAYIIPPDYSKSWREHVNEIAKPGA